MLHQDHESGTFSEASQDLPPEIHHSPSMPSMSVAMNVPQHSHAFLLKYNSALARLSDVRRLSALQVVFLLPFICPLLEVRIILRAYTVLV